MKRFSTDTAIAAVNALSRVLGNCEVFSEDEHEHKVWFIWGASKTHYTPEDKIQFGVTVTSTKQVAEAALKLGIREDNER